MKSYRISCAKVGMAGKKLFHFKLCSSEKRFDIALSERIETARVESSIRIEVGKAEKKSIFNYFSEMDV